MNGAESGLDMKKIKFINSVIISSVLLALPIAKTMISCSSVDPIDEIVLQSDAKCIMPSQSMIIKAIVHPSNIRQIKGII